jgi:glycosyltransferase involved in cell wall biosynthesis
LKEKRLGNRRANKEPEMPSKPTTPFVVYWNNIPTPYMVERFNAVANRGSFDFEAWFNDRREADRSWDVDESSWRFRYRYLPTSSLLGRQQHWPLPILGRKPDVLISLYAEPAFLAGWLVAKLRGSRTAFWCQVTMDRWVQRTRLKNTIKRLVFPQLDASLGHGEQSRRFVMQYGVPSSKALKLPHSIDVRHFAEGSAAARSEREALRSELKLTGVTFLYVGRLWWGKGLDYLLEAFERIQEGDAGDVSLLLLGDGPEEKELKRKIADRGIRNVVFAGFKQKPEIPRYFAASDVFVFPTLGDPYGLVVDEAMACSLPVISTTAAGEIEERIEDGVNGYLVPPEDSASLATPMLALAKNRELRLLMGKVSAEKIRHHTPERWAEDFDRIVRTMLRGTSE